MFETNWKKNFKYKKKNFSQHFFFHSKFHTWKNKIKSPDFYLFAFNQQLGEKNRRFFCAVFFFSMHELQKLSWRHKQRKQQFCCCLFRHQLFNLLHVCGSSGNNCRSLLVPSRVEGRIVWVNIQFWQVWLFSRNDITFNFYTAMFLQVTDSFVISSRQVSLSVCFSTVRHAHRSHQLLSFIILLLLDFPRCFLILL